MKSRLNTRQKIIWVLFAAALGTIIALVHPGLA